MNHNTSLQNIAYLGLGSNLNNPALQVANAIKALAAVDAFVLDSLSSLYQTKALIPPERPHEIQPDYINAVVKIKTYLNPQEILHTCQCIEASFGRQPTSKRWEARIIDIDFLLFGELKLSTAKLTLPHPQIHKRRFVLEPLYEIAPNLQLPNDHCLKESLGLH